MPLAAIGTEGGWGRSQVPAFFLAAIRAERRSGCCGTGAATGVATGVGAGAETGVGAGAGGAGAGGVGAGGVGAGAGTGVATEV